MSSFFRSILAVAALTSNCAAVAPALAEGHSGTLRQSTAQLTVSVTVHAPLVPRKVTVPGHGDLEVLCPATGACQIETQSEARFIDRATGTVLTATIVTVFY
jgi:hypothetical protein